MPGHESWKDRRIVPADEKAFLNIVRDAPRTPPTPGIFDSPTRCYKVNQEWAGHLMGAVTALELWKAWLGAEDDRNPSVQAVSEFLIGEDCTVFKLRQNPLDPCQLQQSLDGGDTWTLAFDYSLCAGAGSTYSATIYIDIAITNIENNQTNYHDAGDVIIIVFPNLEYDTSAEDLNRDAALCYAIHALLNAIFEGALAVANQELNKGKFFSSLVDWTANFFGLSEETLLGALARSVVNLIFGTAALEDAINALENETARDAVQCCLYDNLAGSTVTEAAWSAAGTGCGFGSETDAGLLLAVIDPLFDDLDTYLALMALLSEAVVLSIAGMIGNDCLSLCAPPGNRVNFDAPLEDLPYVINVGQLDSSQSVTPPNSAEGDIAGGTSECEIIDIDLGSEMSVSEITFYHRVYRDGGSPYASRKAVILRDASKVWQEELGAIDTDPNGAWEFEEFTTTPTNDVRYIEVRISTTGQAAGQPKNEFWLDLIEITAT